MSIKVPSNTQNNLKNTLWRHGNEVGWGSTTSIIRTERQCSWGDGFYSIWTSVQAWYKRSAEKVRREVVGWKLGVWSTMCRTLKTDKWGLEKLPRNLRETQNKLIEWYDKRATVRRFCVGDKVLVLFPGQGHPLKIRYYGPWEIEKKITSMNYLVKTPSRKNCYQLCHVNVLNHLRLRIRTLCQM